MAREIQELEPWEPTAAEPWDRVRAGHLLNRAGFGGSPAEIEALVGLGVHRAVEFLLDFPDAPAAEQTRDLPDESVLADVPRTNRARRLALEPLRGPENETARMELNQTWQRASTAFMADATRWWVGRMAFGPHPLQERLTLFWHGHFTTSYRDDRQASWRIWNQNELLRRHAAGNFRDMVRQISRDPAMLKYLNNDRNVRQRPNENYARELMELFTLGIGNYTEEDIKQVARAFTGWGHDGEHFTFNQRQHDDEMKVIFGYRGPFGGDEVISLLMMHPACAPFIGGKLFDYFTGMKATPPIAAAVGEVLRRNDYELRPVLRLILRSRAFFSPERIGGKIKSPVHLLAGTCRLLEAEMPNVPQTRRELEKMGQVLFEPPNVKGWPGQYEGRRWINTATLLARYNFCLKIVDEAKLEVPETADPAAFVDEWLTRLIARPVEAAKRRQLIDAAGDGRGRAKLENVVKLIVSMPEYQLC